MDSGPITTFDFSTGVPFNVTAGVARSLNCSRNGTDSAATLACLREVPLQTLLPASLAQAKTFAPPYGLTVFRALTDGDIIPDTPSRLVSEGAFVKGKTYQSPLPQNIQTHLFAGISIMASWTTDDGSEFVPPSVNSEAAVVAYYSRSLSNSTRDQLLSLYPVEEFEAQVTENDTFTAQWYRASRIYRDMHTGCGSLNLTGEFSRQGNNPTYVFAVNSTRLQPVWNSINQSEYQIGHSSDIPYVFNEVIAGGDNSKSAFQLSAEVSESISAFAALGNPSTSVFDWPAAWSAESGGDATVFVVGGPYGSGPAALGPGRGVPATSSAEEQRSRALAQEKLVERCAFIDSLAA